MRRCCSDERVTRYWCARVASQLTRRRRQVLKPGRPSIGCSRCPTTKGIARLDAPEPSAPAFAFEPGQWLDVHIPAINEVGGYSIASLPNELPLLDLAVKASAHPPAAWCTRSAKVGDRVAIQVGGKFVLREAEAALFVAGGVGISPLYGMLRAGACAPAPTRAPRCCRAQPRRAPLRDAARGACARAPRAPEGLDPHDSASRRDRLRSLREPGIVGGAQGRIGERDLEEALRWIGCEANRARAAGRAGRTPGHASPGPPHWPRRPRRRMCAARRA